MTASAAISGRMPSASAVERLVVLALDGGGGGGLAAADAAAESAEGPRNGSSVPSGFSSMAVTPTDILPMPELVSAAAGAGGLSSGCGACSLFCCILAARALALRKQLLLLQCATMRA